MSNAGKSLLKAATVVILLPLGIAYFYYREQCIAELGTRANEVMQDELKRVHVIGYSIPRTITVRFNDGGKSGTATFSVEDHDDSYTVRYASGTPYIAGRSFYYKYNPRFLIWQCYDDTLFSDVSPKQCRPR